MRLAQLCHRSGRTGGRGDAAVTGVRVGCAAGAAGGHAGRRSKREVPLTAAPRNLALIIGKGVSLNGFLVGHHRDRAAAATAEISGWLTEGRLVFQETVVRGVENTPAAFLDLLAGANTGKMIVALE